MKIDMVVADVDGTLTDATGRISHHIRTGVAALIRSGVRFSLATGRRRKVALPVARELNLTDPILVFDGAAIVDAVTGECLDRQLLLPDMATEAMHSLKAEPALAVYLQEDPLVGDSVITGSEKERSYLSEIYPAMLDDIRVVPGFAEQRLSAVRILAFGESSALSRALTSLANWPGRVMLWPALPTAVLECYAPGVNKGSGLRRLCGLLNVDISAVVAVGDDINDVPLLAAAGIPVAMGNAHPELLHRARFVCDDVERTGIGRLLAAVAADRSLTLDD